MVRLTRKQQVWLEQYLTCWNATEAARRAGYKLPRLAGAENLSKPIIREVLQARLAELAMSADEVLTRLAQQARAEYADYLQPNGTVDLARMLADGKGHLVKGTKWDRNNNLTVEFHDAQAALVHLGKHHGLFVDKSETRVTVDDLDGAIERELERLAQKRQAPNAATTAGADHPSV